jgi:hypothetical protein
MRVPGNAALFALSTQNLTTGPSSRPVLKQSDCPRSRIIQHTEPRVSTCRIWKTGRIVTQLRQALADYTGSGLLTIPGSPKTPNVAATEPRRNAPLLRVVGLSVRFERGANGSQPVSIASINRDSTPAARWA